MALFLLAAAGIALAVSIVPYTVAYRNFRYTQMSLDEQLQTAAQHNDDPLFLYHLGRKLNQRQRFAEARPALERAAGLDPDAAAARDEWARALIGLGQPSAAFSELRQYRDTHPKTAAAHWLLGRFYVTQGHWIPALHALDEAVKLDPNRAEAWSLLAHTRIMMRQYVDAQTALAQAIKLNPGDADNHLQLAVLLDNGDRTQARREYLRAIELAPKDPVCLRQYGRFLLDNSDPPGAERQARAAEAQNPHDMPTQLLLGRALMAQARWTDAAAPLEEAAQLAPFDPQPAEQLRRVYRRLNRSDLADRWETRYLALTKGAVERSRLAFAASASPQDPAVHRQYADALARIGDVNGCVREEALAARTVPDNPRALIPAARALDRYGYSALALPLARQVTSANSQNPEALEALGDILVHLGRLHEAAIDYERIRDWKSEKRPLYRQKITEAAARLAASNAPAERLLRRAEAEHDPQKAEVLLQQALAADPDNTRCLRALLVRQFAGRQAEAAISTATTLMRLSPEDGTAHTLLVIGFLQQVGDRPLSADEDRALTAHLQSAANDFSVAPAFFYARGLLALKHGQAHEAAGFLETAARLNPNMADVYAKLAAARRAAGDATGAKQALVQLQQHIR